MPGAVYFSEAFRKIDFELFAYLFAEKFINVGMSGNCGFPLIRVILVNIVVCPMMVKETIMIIQMPDELFMLHEIDSVSSSVDNAEGSIPLSVLKSS